MDGATQSYAGDLDTHIILLITAKTAILSLSINKKNVTFMEYEKKYKEALDRAKKEWSSNLDNAYKNYRERLEIIFPELNESEDEKIRKAIICGMNTLKNNQKKKTFADIPLDDCIDWLEKQSEQKSTSQMEKCLKCQFVFTGYCNGTCILRNNEQKPADNVEPKFNDGEWIIRRAKGFKHNTYLVKEVKDYYVCEDLKGRRVTFTFNDVHKNFKLWDISDAKDGDVLASELTDSILLFRDIKDNKIDFYCDYDTGLESPYDRFGINDSSEHYGSVEESQDIHPATKEQRDTLIKAMANAGYTFDFEKKEFKKIESKKLDPDKVIAWLVGNICDFEYYVKRFKQDFGL